MGPPTAPTAARSVTANRSMYSWVGSISTAVEPINQHLPATTPPHPPTPTSGGGGDKGAAMQQRISACLAELQGALGVVEQVRAAHKFQFVAGALDPTRP